MVSEKPHAIMRARTDLWELGGAIPLGHPVGGGVWLTFFDGTSDPFAVFVALAFFKHNLLSSSSTPSDLWKKIGQLPVGLNAVQQPSIVGV